MQKIQSGNRLLIYLIGVLTVLMVNKWSLLIIISVSMLIRISFKQMIKEARKTLYLISPFLVTVVTLGFFQSKRGWAFSLLLIIKLVTIALWNSEIFYKFSENDLMIGMNQLRVPRLFTIIIFFIFRYQRLLKEEIKQHMLARELRGRNITRGWFHLRKYAVLGQAIGAGLIRSLDRGDRVYQAMQLRGLNIQMLTHNGNNSIKNWRSIMITVLVSVIVLLLDWGGYFLW